jgi:2-polyprenyl-3-methyl-5-hydroxy-6-metoxy-1,4-benzoquinol methylase
MSDISAFSPNQFETAYPPGIERHFWQIARNHIIKTWLVRADMASGTLLEIGCGRGIVVDHLRSNGMDCVGCDLAAMPTQVPHIFGQTDFRDLQKDLRCSITGVLLFDVIEHIDDAPAFLRSLRPSLPRVSQVLLTVPARAELWSYWDEHYQHFRRYDLRILREELAAAGMEPMRARYIFHSLYLPALLSRKARSSKIDKPAKLLLHKTIAALLIAERYVMPPAIPGTSIIATARL